VASAATCSGGGPAIAKPVESHKFFIRNRQRSVTAKIGIVGDANNRETLDPLVF
jgi:hypothetical protein